MKCSIFLVRVEKSFVIFTLASIGLIRNLDTGSFAMNLVNFLALKLIQHVIAIGSIEVCRFPLTCLGLLCYTSWVKQSNEAMDFLQTLLKDECFL